MVPPGGDLSTLSRCSVVHFTLRAVATAGCEAKTKKRNEALRKPILVKH